MDAFRTLAACPQPAIRSGLPTDSDARVREHSGGLPRNSDRLSAAGKRGPVWLVVANWLRRTMPSENASIFRTPTASDPALAEVVRRLVEAYQPEHIYLFGSVARGDAGPDSDYDLLVVVQDDASPERRRSRLAYEVLRGTGTAADVLVCTRSYFDQRRSLKASLPGTVLREGRALHGA